MIRTKEQLEAASRAIRESEERKRKRRADKLERSFATKFVERDSIYTGFCGNCGRPVGKRQRWCNARCRRIKMSAGAPQADVARLRAEQNGRCAICECELGSDVVVDYDRLTGRQRGLLCRLCNIGLGAFRDNREALARAIGYIARAKENAA